MYAQNKAGPSDTKSNNALLKNLFPTYSLPFHLFFAETYLGNIIVLLLINIIKLFPKNSHIFFLEL